MKKIINLLLVLCMLLSCAACSNQGENSTIIANVDFEIGDTGGLKVPFGNGELIEVVVTDEVGAENTYIFDKLSQVLGVNVKPVLIPVSTSEQKRATILASGDLPDIISLSAIKANEFARQGAFEPVTPYMKELPNILKYFGENYLPLLGYYSQFSL